MEYDETPDTSISRAGGRHFVAACYEIFLGRELEVTDVADERGDWSMRRIVRSVLESDEFEESVRFPITWGAPLPDRLFTGSLCIRHQLWAADLLPLQSSTVSAIWDATDWRMFLQALITDKDFMAEIELPPLAGIDFHSTSTLPARGTNEPERRQVTILGADLSKHARR